jgi:hypothetical protein
MFRHEFVYRYTKTLIEVSVSRLNLLFHELERSYDIKFSCVGFQGLNDISYNHKRCGMLFGYEVYIIAKNIKNYLLFLYLKIKGNLQARMYFTMCNHHNSIGWTLLSIAFLNFTRSFSSSFIAFAFLPVSKGFNFILNISIALLAYS